MRQCRVNVLTLSQQLNFSSPTVLSKKNPSCRPLDTLDENPRIHGSRRKSILEPRKGYCIQLNSTAFNWVPDQCGCLEWQIPFSRTRTPPGTCAGFTCPTDPLLLTLIRPSRVGGAGRHHRQYRLVV